jgi:hypothetical protein
LVYGGKHRQAGRVVDRHVITISDVHSERTIRDVLGEPVLADHDLIDELIDQYLIRAHLQDCSNVGACGVRFERTIV